MGKKKPKYKHVKSAVGIEEALAQSVMSLEVAAGWAVEIKDARSMVEVSKAWNDIARTLNLLDSADAATSETEIVESLSDTEVVNLVGFSPH